jgi:membrane protein DedA with SNARE-associated domain
LTQINNRLAPDLPASNPASGIQLGMPFPLVAPVWVRLEHLGGLGLILLGIADVSMAIPGSLDALTLVLSAHQRNLWPYYASMATLGALLGALVSYSLGRKGGTEALERRISHKRAEKIYAAFSKHGFWTLFIPALLPPPMPFTPFLLAAGALRYPRRRFVAIIVAARSIRYFPLAYLGSSYSAQIFRFLGSYYEHILWTIFALGTLGAIAVAIYVRRRRRVGTESVL